MSAWTSRIARSSVFSIHIRRSSMEQSGMIRQTSRRGADLLTRREGLVTDQLMRHRMF